MQHFRRILTERQLGHMNNINLAKYQPLFDAVFDGDCALAIIGPKGKILSAFPTQRSFDSDVILKYLKSVQLTDNPASDAVTTVSLEHAQQLILKPFILSVEQETYQFAVLINQFEAANKSELHRQLIKLTEVIVDIIIDDSTQESTLNGMVEDISSRYEELNLFYSMDDQIYRPDQDDENTTINEALTKLVRAMHIDSAGLIIPSEKRSIVSCHPHCESEWSCLVQKLDNEKIIDKIETTRNPLVINHSEDSHGLFTDTSLTNKLLIFPIFSNFSEVYGLFFAAKPLHDPDFTNSDRKLCAMVAGQIYKILQYNNDPLTGLLNREGFCKSVLNKRASTLDKEPNDFLLYLNLDRLHIVNQTFGQNTGDQLLAQIAALVQKDTRRDESAARISGDKFAILLKDSDLSDAKRRAKDLQEQLESFRFACQGEFLSVTVSIGLVEITDQFESINHAIKAGDIANQLAKASSGHSIRVYRPEDLDLMEYESTIDWVNKIEDAISNNRFRLYRQAIVPVTAPNPPFKHFEILLRLEDKDGKIIFPDTFIPAAEQFELMPKVDRWVVRNALLLLQRCESDIEISINLSGQSLSDETLGDFLSNEIKKSGIKPERLCFEVTETTAIANLSQALNLISTIKNLGCTFSLDDFGTGMSSFSYLKTFPVDILKIDGAFIKRIVDDPIDQIMVDSMNKIAHQMNLKTVAEFVEDDDIIRVLNTIGVDFAQGYGIHKPEPFIVEIASKDSADSSLLLANEATP